MINVFLFQESRGFSYPEQEVVPSPITHSVTASGSPVAIDSRPCVKMENRDAMVLGTGSLVPTTVTAASVEGESVNSMNQMPPAHLQSSAMVTSAMSQPVTAIPGAYILAQEQPKLQALLQSSGTPAKTRHKTPTVRELLPQTLQQTIIIKPPPQIVHQTGTLVDQGGIVNHHQVMGAVQALQDGQKYLFQSIPVLTHPPTSVSVPVSHVEPCPHGTLVTAPIPLQVPPPRTQEITPSKAETTQVPVPTFTEPASHSNSPMDIDPLSVLCATAAKKQPLPVPNTDNSVQSPSRPPPSNLHVIQPGSAQHEMMDSTRSAEENTPVQVEEDWDPFEDLKQQCSKKLKYLAQKRYVDTTNTARLNIIKGKFC